MIIQNKVINKKAHDASFRDPSGFVFNYNGIYKRCILPLYFKQYNALTSSGFYKKLFDAKLLIPHETESTTDTEIILKPEQLPFISYPYEWSFSQYKAAALLTLKLQKYCIEHDFSLKDASAFNVTFHKGNAVFIDTLSFDFYENDTPWRAYKQFVMHFFGPLVLAKYHGSDVLKLMQTYIDGIPLQLLASLLPGKTKLNLMLYTNIHLLAKFEDKYNEGDSTSAKSQKLTKAAQLKLLTSLYSYLKDITLKEDSEWSNYYDKINYTSTAFDAKAALINTWVSRISPKTLIDIGGNNGWFVRQIKTPLELALVCDIDNSAVDDNYKTLKKDKATYMYPMVIDTLNPSAGIGFQNKERTSFVDRVKALAPDVTLALALIHHMSLSGNVTFDRSAQFFASFSKQLIIEFPKRDDSWVQRLLNSKQDFKHHFDFYTEANFETAYTNYFKIVEKQVLKDTQRVMYLMTPVA